MTNISSTPLIMKMNKKSRSLTVLKQKCVCSIKYSKSNDLNFKVCFFSPNKYMKSNTEYNKYNY